MRAPVDRSRQPGRGAADRGSGRHEWWRFVLEIVVVVAGILVAFALDSWWDGRDRTLQERAHLRALRADFVENVARLGHAAGVEEAIESASRRLLAIGRDGTRTAALDTIRALMGQVFNSGRFEPVMGAYEELVASGGLAQISDDSLRAGIAAFSSHLRAPYAEQYSNSLYFPFIREYADLLGTIIFRELAGDSSPDDARSADAAYRTLLGDRRFLGQVALRQYAERDVGRYYRALQERADAILASLDLQLER